MTNNEYQQYIKTKSPKSPIVKDCAFAFVIGGTICALGQAILNLYMYFGLDEELSLTLVSVTLIFLSALFTGLDWYHTIAKFAGAGTLVPVTGFANAVTAPAIESRTEGFILGVGAKIFTIAGPVILFGELSSMVTGIIYILFIR